MNTFFGAVLGILIGALAMIVMYEVPVGPGGATGAQLVKKNLFATQP
jgi:hypothetical protein